MTGSAEPQQFDVMVDIETLGVSRFAPLMSLGACIFDRYSGNILSDFYRVVKASDVVAHGNFDASTLSWWFKQSNDARQGLMPEEGLGYVDVLAEFLQWLDLDLKTNEGLSPHIFWGNGPNFDMEILSEHFDKYRAHTTAHLRSPWHFRNIRDCRTLWDINGGRPKIEDLQEAIKHNAVSDAIVQARSVMRILTNIRNTYKGE
jgi:exodeoxyribonuclease VIII